MITHTSLITTLLRLYKNGELKTTGTGFYYVSEWGGEKYIFLVSNYHVFSGLDIGKDSNDYIADSLTFYYHMDKDNPSPLLEINVPLFWDNKPIWLTHKTKSVDIAVMPICFNPPMEVPTFGIDKSWYEPDIVISPNDQISLVGYPKGFIDNKNALPIYKTGHIASEYEYDFNGYPYFIIDVSAFAGNSGSPVFLQKEGLISTKKGEHYISTNKLVKFLGIYSAGYNIREFKEIFEIELNSDPKVKRVFENNIDLQLGVVWRASLIQDIIDSYKFEEYKDFFLSKIQNQKFQYRLTNGYSDLIEEKS